MRAFLPRVRSRWQSTGRRRVDNESSTPLSTCTAVYVDREYPVHRYFLYAKQLELTLGGTTPQLMKVGRILAAESA